jgi:hypothetical protein
VLATTRTRRLAAGGVVVGAALLATAPSAAADPVTDAVAALRVSNVYVAPDVSAAKLDSGLAAALPNDVKIAVLPASAGAADLLATEVGRGLGAGPQRPLTIAVVTVAADGRFSMRAASSKYCRSQADAQAQAAAGAVGLQRQGDTVELTNVIQDFVQRLSDTRVDHGDCASGAGAGSAAATVWVWIIGVAVVGAAVVGGLLLYRRRATHRELNLARTRITPLYERLANEINTLDPMEDARARQALADASERFTSAGSVLAGADAVETYGVARRTLLEGLHAARSAREELGIDPGPPLPAPDRSAHERLSEPRLVSVQGQQFQGYPNYSPGAPYYYGGGYEVPGGWYAVPFWETLLLGGALSGGLFGYGCDGYDAGQGCADASDGGGGGVGGGEVS